jgi:hypothetical protein
LEGTNVKVPLIELYFSGGGKDQMGMERYSEGKLGLVTKKLLNLSYTGTYTWVYIGFGQ